MGPALAHKSARQGSGSVEGLRQCATIVCEPRQPIAARRTQQKFSDLFLRWEDVPSLLRNDPFANYARELDHMRARAGRGKMAEDEISKAGRQARFALWEKHGVDAIKHDLLNGGHRLVGGPRKCGSSPGNGCGRRRRKKPPPAWCGRCEQRRPRKPPQPPA